MVEAQTRDPEPQTSGVRLVPPSVPPAPPAGPPRPPGRGSTPPPSPGSPLGGSAALGRYLVECLGDLALIRVSLETRETLAEGVTPDFSLELRNRVEEARICLIQRLQEIDCRICDGPRELSDRELFGFHRAMLDLLRRGAPDSLFDMLRFGPLVPDSQGSGRFSYPLPLRGPYDDPAQDTPTALVRRLLDDLENEVMKDENFTSRERLDLAVSRRLLVVLFACHAGEAPLLANED